MISYKDFEKVLKEIGTQVLDRIERNNLKRNFKNVWSYSLESWCNHFDIPLETQRFILNWGDKKEIKSFTESTWLEWRPEKEYDWIGREKQNYFYGFLEDKFFRKNKMENNGITIILLLSFITIAIGYFLYFQGSEGKKLKVTQNKADNHSFSTPTEAKKSLILVVNALKYNSLTNLKTQKKITPDDSERIYRATESIWAGLQNKIPSQLNDCFSSTNQFQVPKGEETEYDVYMIKIELDELDEGFEAEANQLARIDAFRKLPDLSSNMKISDRLKVSAYKNTGVYKR